MDCCITIATETGTGGGPLLAPWRDSLARMSVLKWYAATPPAISATRRPLARRRRLVRVTGGVSLTQGGDCRPGALFRQLLGGEELIDGFAAAHQTGVRALHQNLRCAGARVVVRAHRHPIGAGGKNGEQIAGGRRQAPLTGKEIGA